jgi:4-hydroxybenzoate polyprenyltransferase
MNPAQPRFAAYIALMRADRPIGTLLLLWPTLWALWLAAGGLPDWQLLLIFGAGTVLMRSAGCVLNDLADRDLDGGVKRTSQRPLVTGTVSTGEALVLFTLLALTAFVLVLFTNTLTILLSLGGLALAACYPFMKRFTHMPQVVLGAAFSWGVLMAFAATRNELPPQAWLLFIANVLWTVAYDTVYAMVDRDDDIKLGIKSTAIMFGQLDRVMVGILQGMTLLALALAGKQFALGGIFYLSLVAAGALFARQQWQIRQREREQCFRAFLANNYVGMVLFAGIALDLGVQDLV